MNATVELWDWRRRVADPYAAVRANPDPHAAWRQWAEVRALLFRTDPQSPIESAERTGYPGPEVFPYDPRVRFEVAPGPAAGQNLDLPGGADGGVSLEPFALPEGLRSSL